MTIAALTEEHVMSLLKGVVDPELGSDIVEWWAHRREMKKNGEYRRWYQGAAV